jgi:hypothetical protein
MMLSGEVTGRERPMDRIIDFKTSLNNFKPSGSPLLPVTPYSLASNLVLLEYTCLIPVNNYLERRSQ